MHGFIVAGTNSGCGKTTVTIGLMALLQSKGMQVAPFKTGPDYIDPAFHRRVTGVPSYNLDSFLLNDQSLQHLFQKHSADSDIAVVEGVMGMYDGLGKEGSGSTWEMAQKLNLPVVLVVNCKGLYQSVIAIIKGFAELKNPSNVRGVILNHVSSEMQFEFLQTLIEEETGLTCIGYLPTRKEIGLKSRHLGLIQADEVDTLPDKIELLRQTLEETIDIQALLKATEIEQPSLAPIELPDLDLSDLHIGVARDKAFSFYYQDNLELLEKLGATLHYFSPLNDPCLPAACNCLYLGGGYPEVFTTELQQNKVLMQEIKQKIDSGMPVYAECGGLMYLTDSIISLENEETPMCGVFNVSVQMTTRLQRFGYAQINYADTITPCHEFHRSQLVQKESPKNYMETYHIRKPKRSNEWECGLQRENCLAAYAHVHFYSNFEFLNAICTLWKKATTSI
ncbi:cobyrinate a,c-diamide synthase [Mangrovibacterium lignilyticum]|uniref:cobyrinate a,c-diamide synthase n=1 Tax=Mangrovibacterium lignilyticum TaxID=2668052 RepID=UPI0013D19793|nr:cobyrinate a,c-diamide synthase [Mangrovibacterium lignilyticum]